MDSVKVQIKDTHHKSDSSKRKQIEDSDEAPKPKRKNKSVKELPPGTVVTKTDVDESGLQSVPQEAPNVSSQATIAISAEDYKQKIHTDNGESFRKSVDKSSVNQLKK